MSTTFVHTLGDSTIDNVYWLLNSDGSNLEQAKSDCVEGRLAANLGKKYTVVSHAVDGFTTSSLLDGDHVGRVLGLQPGIRYPKGVAYLQAKAIDRKANSFFCKPLESLQEHVQAHPDAVHYVILSVAGNDFRERLFSPASMLLEIPNILLRYAQIVDKIQQLPSKNVRPILMMQYRLDANNDHYGIYQIMNAVGLIFGVSQAALAVAAACSAAATVAKKIHPIAGSLLTALSSSLFYLSSKVIPVTIWPRVFSGQNLAMATLSGLMESFYKPILARAKADKIPVLDLPNTLDPHKPLFTSQIEPNKEGGTLIAEGLAHIIKTHNHQVDPSLLYAKNGSMRQFQALPNPGSSGWKVL